MAVKKSKNYEGTGRVGHKWGSTKRVTDSDTHLVHPTAQPDQASNTPGRHSPLSEQDFAPEMHGRPVNADHEKHLKVAKLSLGGIAPVGKLDASLKTQGKKAKAVGQQPGIESNR